MQAYLDNSATTKCAPEVVDVCVKVMSEDYGNPSSKHMKGVEAENYIKEAKETIAKTLKCQEKEILFTSGGTESNNMAIIGTAMANKRKGNHVIVSSVEHSSVKEPFNFLSENGFRVTYLKVDRNGIVDLNDLKEALDDETILVSVMYVNNEIGAAEPIEEIGHIVSIQRHAFSQIITISASDILEETKVGDSIAVNGVCLTVTSIGSKQFSADVMHETINKSSLGNLRAGMAVNLERAMPANGRFGGHIVSGHIDGVGRITKISKDDNAVWYTINAGKEIMQLIVPKGSITIDGISLTVAGVNDDSFKVSVIPHTRQVTTLSQRRINDCVNLENDIVGKYIKRLLQTGGSLDVMEEKQGTISGGQRVSVKAQSSQRQNTSGITREFLSKYGF